MASAIPDTNEGIVALIAITWEIVMKEAFEESKMADSEWLTAKFDEVYKQLYKTVYGN